MRMNRPGVESFPGQRLPEDVGTRDEGVQCLSRRLTTYGAACTPSYPRAYGVPSMVGCLVEAGEQLLASGAELG